MTSPQRPVIVCYQPQPPKAQVNRELCEELHLAASNASALLQHFVVPKRCGRAWKLLRGQVCRISLTEGSQVGFCVTITMEETYVVVRVLKQDISSMVVIFLFISNRLVTSTFGIWKIPRNDFIPEKQGSSKDRTLLPETDYG